MKNITEEKNKFLFHVGYGEKEQLLSKLDFDKLPAEEKGKYKEIPNGHHSPVYSKEKEVSKYGDIEFNDIVQMETYFKLDKIEKHLKTIKKCNMFFVGLTILSIIVAYLLFN